MKRWCCILLVVFLIMGVFTGCQGKSMDYAYTTSAVSKDPLVICVDLENFVVEGGSTHQRDVTMQDFLRRLEHTGGLANVAIEFVPPTGTERKTFLDRLRVEIMAGGGPDVFLMAFHGDHEIDAALNLFEYPQKAMENGFFLPLDEYMENNTQFAEWDKQTQGVMAAGRNEEGQQIIPLSYTLPLIVYEQEKFEYTPIRELTWNDMLHDPELSPFARDLANCYDYDWSLDPEEAGGPCYYLEYILGELADFEKEELLFTEEELLQRVKEILALGTDDLNDDPAQDYYSAIEEWTGLGLRTEAYNKPMTMIPMYCDDGGVTAVIQKYAAINRNTKHPEEAFTVLDVLMQKDVQQRSHLYQYYIQGADELPMHEDLFQEETPIGAFSYVTDENYQELCEVRDQITGANFRGEYREILNVMLFRCRNPEAYDKTVEELVHEAYENMQRRVRE